MIKRNCIICGKEFEIIKKTDEYGRFQSGFNSANKKTCSYECFYKNKNEISRLHQEKRKTIKVERKCKQCGEIVISTKYSIQNFCGGKFGQCYRDYFSKIRKGKANPSYRNGLAIQGKRTYTGIHLRACSKYRKDFLEKHEYLFCEVCGGNVNSTPRFEVHHIYFASQKPKHKELHNFKNLIMVCIGCHNKFHKNELRDVFLRIEKERGLKELFK